MVSKLNNLQAKIPAIAPLPKIRTPSCKTVEGNVLNALPILLITSSKMPLVGNADETLFRLYLLREGERSGA